MKLYKILLRDNVNQRFITLLNQDRDVFENNLSKCMDAQDNLKCNIIFYGITTDKEDLIQVAQ